MPRQARIDYPGLLHHVLIRGIERRRIFLNDGDKDYFLDQLEAVLSLSQGAKIYAWALMPNHVHLLIFVSHMPLKSIMRRLLTRYAVYFNRAHKRVGHLFQNRYKSLVVDHDSYFLELIRYIHLNPIHSYEVKSLHALAHYAYTGHSALLGHVPRSWQETEYTLKEFGSTRSRAISGYLDFLKEGIKEDKRPDLTRGGIMNMMNLDDSYKKTDRFDERVLGGGSFVDSVLEGEDNGPSSAVQPPKLRLLVERLVGKDREILRALYRGSKEAHISRIRHNVCQEGIRQGYQVADIARELNVNVSSVSRAITRRLVKQ